MLKANNNITNINISLKKFDKNDLNTYPKKQKKCLCIGKFGSVFLAYFIKPFSVRDYGYFSRAKKSTSVNVLYYAEIDDIEKVLNYLEDDNDKFKVDLNSGVTWGNPANI